MGFHSIVLTLVYNIIPMLHQKIMEPCIVGRITIIMDNCKAQDRKGSTYHVDGTNIIIWICLYPTET